MNYSLRGRLAFATGSVLLGFMAVFDIATGHASAMVWTIAAIAGLFAIIAAAGRDPTRRLPGSWIRAQPAGSTGPAWLLQLALATGFPSSASLVIRSVLGVAAGTLVQRFGLYPSAALAFDVSIAIVTMAIMLLFAFFIVRTRYQP